MSGKLRVVVLGCLVRLPFGIAWHYLHYIRGLRDLGCDVYYMEDSYDRPSCYRSDGTGPTSDPNDGLNFAGAALQRVGLARRWAYYDAFTANWHGPAAAKAFEICRTADVVLQISGLNPIRDWLAGVPLRIMIDTDPGFTQIRNLTKPEYRRRAEEHNVHFSFGENIEGPDCLIPADGFAWRPTRQPLVAALWPMAGVADAGRYTTIMAWHSFGSAVFEHAGLRLGMKNESVLSMIDLPARCPKPLQIGIAREPAEEHEIAGLQALGWDIFDPIRLNSDPWEYQRFIEASRGEIGFSKAGYVVARSGWFSERSVQYLASGRPVLHQDTGFSRLLPCGCGLFSFSSTEEAIDAIARIESDYRRHSRAAREIAIEYFSAAKVLGSLLDRAFDRDRPRAAAAPGARHRHDRSSQRASPQSKAL